MEDSGAATVLSAAIALVAAVAVQVLNSRQNGKAHALETVLRIIDGYRADAFRLLADDRLALGRMGADLAVVHELVGYIRDASESDILVPPKALEPPTINEVTYKYFAGASEPLQKL